MSNFRIGQKVVCIDARPYALDGDPTNLVNGAVYTVSSFADVPVGLKETIYLAETLNMPPYRSERFRPLVERKTDISIFTAMLNPSKQLVMTD